MLDIKMVETFKELADLLQAVAHGEYDYNVPYKTSRFTVEMLKAAQKASREMPFVRFVYRCEDLQEEGYIFEVENTSYVTVFVCKADAEVHELVFDRSVYVYNGTDIANQRNALRTAIRDLSEQFVIDNVV